MILAAVSLLPLAIWAYLLFGRGWFWLCGERDDAATAAANYVRQERAAFGSNRHREERSDAAIRGS